ncbi:hypothetical protein Nepgr_010712 [Nepenthes gracilis]|uniref:Uncharacterized protein n=1 Tax=Nepenthes gracilis TaxID=150966 RepID=A0AAD3SD58_NEPGR|nr:hypothetical protein Nepgr_010712 [Nepenthes gracilis]
MGASDGTPQNGEPSRKTEIKIEPPPINAFSHHSRAIIGNASSPDGVNFQREYRNGKNVGPIDSVFQFRRISVAHNIFRVEVPCLEGIPLPLEGF